MQGRRKASTVHTTTENDNRKIKSATSKDRTKMNENVEIVTANLHGDRMTWTKQSAII